MKSARTTLNFSDTIAFDERWHDAGQRYVTFNCYVSASARGIEPTLEKLARTLSPDDRFAVDMFELGSRFGLVATYSNSVALTIICCVWTPWRKPRWMKLLD
jgi:hypothetical protein